MTGLADVTTAPCYCSNILGGQRTCVVRRFKTLESGIERISRYTAPQNSYSSRSYRTKYHMYSHVIYVASDFSTASCHGVWWIFVRDWFAGCRLVALKYYFIPSRGTAQDHPRSRCLIFEGKRSLSQCVMVLAAAFRHVPVQDSTQLLTGSLESLAKLRSKAWTWSGCLPRPSNLLLCTLSLILNDSCECCHVYMFLWFLTHGMYWYIIVFSTVLSSHARVSRGGTF